jgi:hypothetical protein
MDISDFFYLLHYGHLCLIFGIPPSVCSRVINIMLKRTVQLLSRDHPLARVQFPDDAKMRDFANMVKWREPMVNDIIGFLDTVLFLVQCTDKQITQNVMYCGYNSDTMVNNVFAFGPDGKVFFAAVNIPGSWADGSLTARFLPYIKRKIGAYKFCVDQGFPWSGDAHGTFVDPVTKWQAQCLHCDIRNYLLKISNVHTLLQQASKWGMHGLQGTFPCCKSCLPSDSVQCRLVLKAIILVHNFRRDYVGYS